MYAGYPLMAAGFVSQTSITGAGVSSMTDVSTGVARFNHTGNECNSVKVAKGFDGPFFMQSNATNADHIIRYDYEYSSAGDTEVTNRRIDGSGFGTLTDISENSMVHFNDFDTSDLASTYSGDPRYPNLGVIASAYIYISGGSAVIGVSTGYTSVTEPVANEWRHNINRFIGTNIQPIFFQHYASGQNVIDEFTGSTVSGGYFDTRATSDASGTIEPDYITTIVFEPYPDDF